jgi:hypothetical protein
VWDQLTPVQRLLDGLVPSHGPVHRVLVYARPAKRGGPANTLAKDLWLQDPAVPDALGREKLLRERLGRRVRPSHASHARLAKGDGLRRGNAVKDVLETVFGVGTDILDCRLRLVVERFLSPTGYDELEVCG